MLDMAADYVNKKGWSVDDALRHVHMSTFGLDETRMTKGKYQELAIIGLLRMILTPT